MEGMLWASEGVDKHPVYVGARSCASCHQGKGFGHQCSQWLLSKHARAYAVLARPEARKIAELSGISQEPQECALCLGCHATGAHVEAWEREDTFHIEDGVQCEKCHGPGSEYMGEAIMMDREQAQRAGLMFPDMGDCLVCHQEKGSHVAIHQLDTLDMEKALKDIAHPTPGRWYYHPKRNSPFVMDQVNEAKYIGVHACAKCHKGPKSGYQFSMWRTSPHARAFAVLSTPKAYERAKEMGLGTAPQYSPECLKCHTTAFSGQANGSMPSYGLDEGVGCEACHGAGSAYAAEAHMKDPRAAQDVGLNQVSKDTCLACHENAHDQPFDFDAAKRSSESV